MRVAPQATQTTGRVASQRAQRSCSSSGWVTAASHRSQRASSPHARQASSRARPVRLSTHSTLRSLRRARTSAGGRSPVWGSSRRMSTTSTTGHPARSSPREVRGAARRRAPRATGTARSGRRARPPARPARAPRHGRATSGPAPAGGLRRARRRPRPRPSPRPASRPRRGCRPPWHPPRPGPSHGDGRRRATPARRNARATWAATGAVGHRTSAWPRRGRRHGHHAGIGRGRQPQHGSLPPEGVVDQPVDRVAAVHGGHGHDGRGPGQAGDVALGRRRAQERRRTTGPAPGGPPGEVDEIGPGAAPGPLRQRPEVDPGGRLDVDLDHPPADPPRAEGDPDTVPDAHLVPERVGDQVVERLVDGGLVDEHADDLPSGEGIWEGKLGLPSRPAHRPNADLMSSTRVVCSQVSSLSLRPKWP